MSVKQEWLYMLTLLGLMYITTDQLLPEPTTHSLHVSVEQCVWDERPGVGVCLMIDGPGGWVSLFAEQGIVIACRMHMNFMRLVQPCPPVFGLQK